MIKVWTDAAEAGLLDRHGERGSTFAYLPDTPAARAVSITMPVRLPSWSVNFGLPPIFEMNLPEGFLRERLRLAFAKAGQRGLLSVVPEDFFARGLAGVAGHFDADAGHAVGEFFDGDVHVNGECRMQSEE